MFSPLSPLALLRTEALECYEEAKGVPEGVVTCQPEHPYCIVVNRGSDVIRGCTHKCDRDLASAFHFLRLFQCFIFNGKQSTLGATHMSRHKNVLLQ